MRKLLAIFLVCSYSQLSLAQPKDIPPGEDKIVPLKQGEPSPFSGQLFENNTALRWAYWLAQYKFLLRSQTELEKKKAELEINSYKDRLNLVESSYRLQITGLQTQLTQATAPRPWYQSPWFFLALGASLTAGAFTTGILLLK